MKRFTMMLLALCSVASSGCAEVSPQLQAIGMTFARGAGFAIPFMTGLIVLIFLMNKFITKHGRTDDQLCSIIGVITFPLIWFGVLYWRFGFSWIIIAVSAAAGGLTGWFSYTIDELLENYWEQRIITVPGTLGLLLNGVLVSTMFTAVWLEGEMYITQKACVTRVVVERYTRHTSSDSKGHTHTTYTWDYYSHKDQMADGWDFPRLQEGRDYVLGMGSLGKKDQIRNEYYQFIGGYFWSGKHHKWKDFQWLLLQHRVSFVTGRVQKVQSNYFGNPIGNGGSVERSDLPQAIEHPLPLDDVLPNPTGIGKVLHKGYEIFKQLFTEEEYRVLLYPFLFIFILLILLAALIPAARPSIAAFFAMAFFVVFLILLVVAARTGGLEVLERRSSRGGGFGGRG